MNRLIFYVTLAALGLLSFTATAFAAGAAAPEDGSILDLARPIWDAATGGHWWLAGSLALVLSVAAFKRYAPGRAGEFARSDLGGALLVLTGAFGGALAASLAGATAMSVGLAWSALKVAVGSAGGYSLIKKLVVDPLLGSAWYAAKAPAWLKAALDLVVGFVFAKPAPAIAKAEKAGDDAVAASPPTGADGIAGPPVEL